jgi:hypothetical protein
MKLPQTVIHTFFAVGNSEISKDMASHTTDQKVFVIKTVYFSGGSCVAVERHSREFSVRVAPLRDAIYWIIKQREEGGSVCDKCVKGCTLVCMKFVISGDIA